MNLNVAKTHPEARLPEYSGYADDAAFDLYTTEDVEVAPNAPVQIPTGIAMEIPTGYVGLIWDKSGLSHTYALKTLGGVIDSGYRGEVKVGMINLGSTSHFFKKGEKIAQMLIQQKEIATITEVDQLSDTERGNKGFGSSGK